MNDIDSTIIVEEYIEDEEWGKDNANYNRSNSGLKTHIASKILKEYACNTMGKFGEFHRKGIIYLHNLDSGSLAPYCNGNNIETLLSNGLINPTGISSLPAKHFDVALDHLVNFSYMMTQEFAGAQAWRDIDIYLAPYIYYDGLTYKEIKQAIQRMIWNVSFPLRSGFQSMFLNLTFGLRPSKYYKNKPVIHPREKGKNTYADFQDEIDEFNVAFLDVMLEGANGYPFTFPLPTYNVAPDFKWDSLISDLIFGLAAKYGSPYFANYLNTDLSEDDALSMCCRLKLNTKEVQKVSGGIWNFGANTGALAVATINMPQLGYLCKGSEVKFYNRLDSVLEICKEYLLLKKQRILEGIGAGLFPMIKNYIPNIANTYFLTVGNNGLNECSINFSGLDIIDNVDWCENVLFYINKKVLEMQQETGHLFNFESTPAEGASSALAQIDRAQYPDIFTQGTKEAPYYTGSSLIPHHYEMGLFDLLEHQERLQQYYTGGSVLHIDTLEADASWQESHVKELIRGICENTKLPYVTWSPTFGVCSEHGQVKGKTPCCEKANIYSRIVGYYRPISRWNKGKVAEFKVKKGIII